MSLSIGDVNVEQYFFPRLSVEANSAHKPGEENMTIFSVNEELTETNQPKRFAMELSVESNQEQSTNPPYFFRIDAFGFFNVISDDADPDEMQAICRIVGRRILMGAAREQVAIMTSRGPWETLHLRAISGTGELSKIELEDKDE